MRELRKHISHTLKIILTKLSEEYLIIEKIKEKGFYGTIVIKKNIYNIIKIQVVDEQYIKRARKKKDIHYLRKNFGKILSLVAENDNSVIKIEFLHNPRKKNRLVEEFNIIKMLNINGCKSCPEAKLFGKLKLNKLSSNNEELSALISQTKSTVNFMIIERLIRLNNSFSIEKLISVLIEQAKFGVIQNDIKPENIFSKENNRVLLIDYDQAILNENFKKLNDLEVIKKTIEIDYESYRVSKRGWLRHFKHLYYKLHIKKFFDNNGNFISKK